MANQTIANQKIRTQTVANQTVANQAVANQAVSILQKYFGYGHFRVGQQELIDRILAGQDVLGVMPTGAGKSLCYQVPALIFAGTTLVISPLISLMKDQVNALTQAGVSAAYINSTLTAAQQSDVFRHAAKGSYRILYIAPERLETESFARLAQTLTIPLVAVDEAHCISQWGQDFRPSYLKIPHFISSLPVRPILTAFTATATEHVRDDITTTLRLKDPFSITTGFDRPNLHFAVARPRDKQTALSAFLAQRRHEGKSGESGIIYCATRKTVEQVTENLQAEGLPAARYHAGLSDAERRRNQDDFLYDRRPLMVATNAFGMGIDKSNVAFIVHYNMPKNIESYYQEAGRAGRDGAPAMCVLFYSPADVQTAKFLITHGNDDAETDELTRYELREKDLALLAKMTAYATTTSCLRAFLLSYFGECAHDACGNCSNCVGTFEELDVTEDTRKVLSCVYRLRERGSHFGKKMLIDILRGSKGRRVLDANLQTLSTYGLMTEQSSRYLDDLITYLCETGHLLQTGGEYPVLQWGTQAHAMLQDDFHLNMKRQIRPKEQDLPDGGEKTPTTIKRKRGTKAGVASADPALFEKLRTVRSNLAQEEGLPAYIIFADAALHSMVELLPRTEEAFLEVSGVGAVKQERYGHAFLTCINDHLAARDVT